VASAGIDIGRRQVFQALMVTLMVVVPDEGRDVGFEITRHEVILEQNAVLHRLVPAFDFALSLWMIRSAACMRHAFVFQIVGQIAGDVTRSIARQQAWAMCPGSAPMGPNRVN